ncbi:MAG: glycosyltransferase [Bacteroidia bacterium]|nr:glycosyltransferase [Bacteroidia bacterium]
MEKTNILFIGHDLKFLDHVIDHFSKKKEYDVQLFQYKSHVIHDFECLLEKLPGADIIFCEWGLGNISWLSRNKLPGQKLVVRIHAQEFSTSYLSESNWAYVDQIILVGPHMLKKFTGLFPAEAHKCRLIYNIIDCNRFDLDKDESALYHLGYLGVLPRLKAPHRGLEILEELKKKDDRYKIFIKSKRPDELVWLWDRPDEKKYYNELFERITEMGLEDSIVWDPHGRDVQEWFQKIGFILSTSDHESFHLSIPEGMASGAIPVIRNWEGARELYPEKYIFEDLQGAVNTIYKWSDPENFQKEQPVLKDFARKNFDLPVILKQYDHLFSSQTHVRENQKTSPSVRTLIKDKLQNKEESISGLEAKTQIQLKAISDFEAKTQIQLKTISDFEAKTQTQVKEITGLKEKALARDQAIQQHKEKIESLLKVIDEYKDRIRSKEKLIEGFKNQSQKQEQVISHLKEKSSVHEKSIRNLKETVLVQQFKIQYLEQRFLNKLLIIGREQVQNLYTLTRRLIKKK